MKFFMTGNAWTNHRVNKHLNRQLNRPRFNASPHIAKRRTYNEEYLSTFQTVNCLYSSYSLSYLDFRGKRASFYLTGRSPFQRRANRRHIKIAAPYSHCRQDHCCAAVWTCAPVDQWGHHSAGRQALSRDNAGRTSCISWKILFLSGLA